MAPKRAAKKPQSTAPAAAAAAAIESGVVAALSDIEKRAKPGAKARSRRRRSESSDSGSDATDSTDSLEEASLSSSSSSATKASVNVDSLLPLLVAQALDAQKADAETKAAVAALDNAQPKYILPTGTNTPAATNTTASTTVSTSTSTDDLRHKNSRAPSLDDDAAEVKEQTFIEPLPDEEAIAPLGFRLFCVLETNDASELNLPESKMEETSASTWVKTKQPLGTFAELKPAPFLNSVRNATKLMFTYPGDGKHDDMTLRIELSAVTHVHSGAYHSETIKKRVFLQSVAPFKANQSIQLDAEIVTFINKQWQTAAFWNLRLVWLSAGLKESHGSGVGDFTLTRARVDDLMQAVIGIATPKGISRVPDSAADAGASAGAGAGASAGAAAAGAASSGADAMPHGSSFSLKQSDVIAVQMNPVAPLPEVKMIIGGIAEPYELKSVLSSDRKRLQFFPPLEAYSIPPGVSCTFEINGQSFRSVNLSVDRHDKHIGAHLIAEADISPTAPAPYKSEDINNMPIYTFEVLLFREAVLQHYEFPQLHWREHEGASKTLVMEHANADGKFIGSLTRNVSYKMWYWYPRRGKKSSEVLIRSGAQ